MSKSCAEAHGQEERAALVGQLGSTDLANRPAEIRIWEVEGVDEIQYLRLRLEKRFSIYVKGLSLWIT